MALEVCQHILVLIFAAQDDLPCSRGSIVSQVASKSRNSRNDDDDSELATLLACSDTSINNGLTNLVVDGCLFFSRRSDEELIFDVDKVLGVPDYLTVCVLNAVLSQDTT